LIFRVLFAFQRHLSIESGNSTRASISPRHYNIATMASTQLLWSHRLLIFTIIFSLLAPSWAISNKYCSTLNTASTGANSSLYQSMGLCSGFCNTNGNNYAFAVLKSNECWCSDYVPGVQLGLEGCSTPCPGYPDDLCGGDGEFGYVQLVKAALGTKGAISSSPALTAPAPPPPTTPKLTTTPPPTPSKDRESVPPTSTWTPTPIVSLETVTGQVRTVTVTPTAPPNTVTAVNPTKSKGLGTGSAVGIAIGVVLIVTAICGLIIWLWFRKRRQQAAAEAQDSQRSSTAGFGSPGGLITRSMSENSRFVLASNGKTVVGGFEPETPGSHSSRLSTHGLKPVDPRLNPWGSGYRNQSRESINTVHDSQDYSRKILGVANPDLD